MEEFLLEIEGRLVRVLIEDERGADGSVPTLVCRSARWAQIVPSAVRPPPPPPPPDDDEDDGSVLYPGFPLVLSERIRAAEEPVLELHLDVSGLPMGPVPFALEEFATQAAKHAAPGGGPPLVMDGDMARAWGCELVDA
jgi:hypothetical protein